MLRCTQGIQLVYSWYSSGVLNTLRCTHDIRQCTEHILCWVVTDSFNFFLSNFRHWKYVDKNLLYELSFCDVIKDCGNSVVCQRNFTTGKKLLNFGVNSSSVLTSAKLAKDNSGFTLTFTNGDTCPHDNTRKLSSEVNFMCGKILVSFISYV